ncbi:MAG: GAF domain-containing protein, partial [Ktedonobacterales bacterium]
EEAVAGSVRIPLGEGVAGRIMAERRPMIVDDLTAVEVANPFLREHLRSLLGVPLLVEQRILGVMHVDTIEQRQFTGEERDFLQLVADRVALAIDHARLFEAERSAREAAEVAQDRLQFLSETTASLAASLDYEATLNRLAKLLVPALADWCLITVPDQGVLRTVASAYTDDDLGQAMRELRDDFTVIDMDAPYGVGRVLRTGQPELLSSVTDANLQALAGDDAHHLDILRRLRPQSEIAVPLEAHGYVAGVVTLVSTSPQHHYTAEDLTLAGELARRAALAIENARLYGESQRALTQVAEIAEQIGHQAGQLNTIIEAIPGGVLVCDAAGQITRVNANAAALVGLVPGTIAQPLSARTARVLSSLDGEPLPRAEYPLDLALHGATRLDARYLLRQRLPDGKEHDITVQCSFAPIRDASGAITGAVAVATDISELYRLERQKEEFLSVASHELKTPLTTLKILTQLTHKRLEKLDLLEAGHAQRMERAIWRMERLIGDLLDVTRIDSGKLALHLDECDLVALCREAAAEQMEATERVVTLALPEQPVMVRIDVERIEQVLTNLLSNALKYSPPGSPVALQLTTSGDTVVVAVLDEGGGIPASALPQLFERFYRVPGVQVQSGSGVGMGLGLFITREIIARHGGRIWAESAVGSGSRFAFTLPLGGRRDVGAAGGEAS